MPEISDELMPCPFCGGPAIWHDIREEDEVSNFGGSVIVCTQCEACSAVEFDQKDTLIERWNRRSEVKAARAGKGVGEPDYWAVWSKSGAHIGLWRDWETAERVAGEYTKVGAYVQPLSKLEKLDTYEMRAAHLDEMAREFEDAARAALTAASVQQGKGDGR